MVDLQPNKDAVRLMILRMEERVRALEIEIDQFKATGRDTLELETKLGRLRAEIRSSRSHSR